MSKEIKSRDIAIGYLKSQIIGPEDSTIEILNQSPQITYTMGVLYPLGIQDSDDIKEEIDYQNNEESSDNNLTNSSSSQLDVNDEDRIKIDPLSVSSCGISFFIEEAEEIKIKVWGANYKEIKKSERYFLTIEKEINENSENYTEDEINDINQLISKQENNKNKNTEPLKKYLEEKSLCGHIIAPSKGFIRNPIYGKDSPEEVIISSENQKVKVLKGTSEIISKWRNTGNGYLVTITLQNVQHMNIDDNFSLNRTLFQVGFNVSLKDKFFQPYPQPDKTSLFDEESIELIAQYQNHKTYAIGHGCSPIWNELDSPNINKITAEFMPSHEVFRVMSNPNINNFECFSANKIGWELSQKEIIESLERFIDSYSDWIKDQKEILKQPSYKEASSSIGSKLDITISRMKASLRILENNADAYKAFKYMNRAIVIQNSRKDLDPENYKEVIFEENQKTEFNWFAFQMGFILLSIESIIYEDSDFNDTVDLLAFPTGGGKTEAYLGIIGFIMFYSRIKDPKKIIKTQVISRYTLRLLTSQQFIRTSQMIMACEFIRRRKSEEIGISEINIGLWVGSDNTPNSISTYHARGGGNKAETAYDIYKNMIDTGDISNSGKLIIQNCLWCGKDLFPSLGIRSKEERKGLLGIFASNETFFFKCPNSSCEFAEKIPINVIDQSLYDNPPSVLLATVDKFANFATESRASVFLGDETSGPELIIQDELHLLSGPLGTVMGLYESAFNSLMEYRGHRPKIIASTATTRNYKKQSKGLFGKNAIVFPPQATEINETFFSTVDKESPGRMYLGSMTQCQAPTMGSIINIAAMLNICAEKETEIKDLSEEMFDSYWTLIIYHNSLTELGKTLSATKDEIPTRMKQTALNQENIRKNFGDENNIIELRGSVDQGELQKDQARMNKVWNDKDEVSAVVTTNIMSVGVDYQRLGLMIVLGQPKTTSEYIQATSRVGRKVENPGIVLTHYRTSMPRDRSHYESFKSYHQNLYKELEPSSVTPFTVPALNKAFSGVLIALFKHGLGLKSSDGHKFNSEDEKTSTLIDLYKETVKRYTNEETKILDEILKERISQWNNWKKEAEEDGPGQPLHINVAGNNKWKLTKSFGSTASSKNRILSKTRREPWEILSSMRAVEDNVYGLERD